MVAILLRPFLLVRDVKWIRSGWLKFCRNDPFAYFHEACSFNHMSYMSKTSVSKASINIVGQLI
jgi:hypothetical protein